MNLPPLIITTQSIFFRIFTILCALFLLDPLLKKNAHAEVNAHSHNDYEQSRPLFEALESGFGSVEADVFLVQGRLLIGHSVQSLKPHRTLESMYLDPLRAWFKAHPDSSQRRKPLQLLVDVKTEANSTWIALHSVFTNYSDLLTRFESTNTIKQSVMVVISGNRSVELMQQQQPRYAAYDGRLEDLTAPTPRTSAFMPLVSGAWPSFFKWRGHGEFPELERKQLQAWVLLTHQQGRTLRFWGAPDELNTWRELASAGVDWINTDHIVALADFLRTQPRPVQAPRTP